MIYSCEVTVYIKTRAGVFHWSGYDNDSIVKKHTDGYMYTAFRLYCKAFLGKCNSYIDNTF